MIPLLYLLYFYAFFALLGLLFLFFNVYHMAKFGLQNTKTYFFVGLYLVLFFGVLFVSLLFLAQVNWSQTIELDSLIQSIIGNNDPILSL
jgi:hypothetical protein